GIDFLRSADLDGDGRNDLVVVNNARSKITLLYNQTGLTNAPGKARNTPKPAVGRRDVNELPPDARFRIDSISSEKRISSLVVADLNGDARPDLAYFGEPKELVIQLNQGTNAWSLPRRMDLGDGLLDANALASGDLNGDGLPDLLLLAEKHVHFLRQRPDHTLADAVKIPYTGTVKAVQVHDIDGDGRQDLLLVNWDHPNPFRFRLQDAQGQLGPETHLPFAPVRSYTAEDLDGDRRTEFVTIAAKSGRAAVSNVRRKKGEAAAGSLLDGPFSVLPLPRTDKSRRGVAWADINGDQRPDLLVADPEGGQLLVHVQQADGTLASPRTYPAFSGITDIASIDWDRDGAPELFMLSPDEKQVGLAKVEKSGRVAFPSPLNLPGKPLAMAAGRLRQDEPVVAIVTEREERRGKDAKADAGPLREIVLVGTDQKPVVQPLAESFKGNPSAVAFHDADQDGLADIVVLTPYEKIKVLRQRAQPKDGQRFEEIDVNPPGGTSDAPWLAFADADADGRPELLLAQKNFVRAVVLQGTAGNDASWNFAVRDQINGASSSSRIVGAAALPVPGSKSPALFLFDMDRKGLTLCTRNDAGVWQAGKTLSLPVTDFASLAPVSLGTDGTTGPNAIAFLGANGVAWKQFSGESWELGELDGYETPVKDGFLHDVIAGDLNQDRRLDLVFLETTKAYVDIVTFEKPHTLNPATRWQVFEERTFRQRRPVEAPEPREALVAEFTGDGKPDLVLLVHDRILLYPQE
ncbi:MAG: FG-GAP repeat domain-containing protein, partial [Verrucomicrobiota bacterium]